MGIYYRKMEPFHLVKCNKETLFEKTWTIICNLKATWQLELGCLLNIVPLKTCIRCMLILICMVSVLLPYKAVYYNWLYEPYASNGMWNYFYIWYMYFLCFFFKSEGSRDIIALGTIPLATIEKFNKIVSYALSLYRFGSTLTSFNHDYFWGIKF